MAWLIKQWNLVVNAGDRKLMLVLGTEHFRPPLLDLF